VVDSVGVRDEDIVIENVWVTDIDLVILTEDEVENVRSPDLETLIEDEEVGSTPDGHKISINKSRKYIQIDFARIRKKNKKKKMFTPVEPLKTEVNVAGMPLFIAHISKFVW